MSITISIQLSPGERDALLARANSKGITIEDEAKQLIHDAVVEEADTETTSEEDPLGIKGLSFGEAIAKIWEGYEGPDFEIPEIREYGRVYDPFAEDE
jgi:hypothetical protein